MGRLSSQFGSFRNTARFAITPRINNGPLLLGVWRMPSLLSNAFKTCDVQRKAPCREIQGGRTIPVGPSTCRASRAKVPWFCMLGVGGSVLPFPGFKYAVRKRNGILQLKRQRGTCAMKAPAQTAGESCKGRTVRVAFCLYPMWQVIAAESTTLLEASCSLSSAFSGLQL